MTSIAMDLDSAMALLPGPASLCIALSYHERMTHEEISNMTGMQLGTVKSHIRRGSKRLRELLSAYDETTDIEETP
jgi:RNA polymerase sigma-70 factor (ECF subfamily)